MTKEQRQEILGLITLGRGALGSFMRGVGHARAEAVRWETMFGPAAKAFARAAVEPYALAEKTLDQLRGILDACELAIATTPAASAAPAAAGPLDEAIAGVETLLCAALVAATRATQSNPPTLEEWRQVQATLASAIDLVASFRALEGKPAVH